MESRRPLIPYNRHFVDASDARAITDVLKKGWLSQGPKVQEFENQFAEKAGARYAVAVSSGTAALHLCGLVAGLGHGDEAITTPMTFVATANAALYCGARPVFADVRRDTLNLDMDLAARKVTRKTKAVLPVDFAGYPCPTKAHYKYFKKNGVTVIRDACHSLGGSYAGGPVGDCRFADLTVFSFHPIKSITTGEGGMITTNDKRFYEALLRLRNHGLERDPSCLTRNEGPWFYEMLTLGFNYRLTDLQCALGLSQLKKLDGFIKKRKSIAAFYLKQLKTAAFVQIPQAGIVDYLDNSSHHLFIVRLRRGGLRRKPVVEALRALGIGTQVHYIPVHRHPFYEKLGFKKGLCPVAETEYEKILSLPLYYEMSLADAKTVIDGLGRVCGGEV